MGDTSQKRKLLRKKIIQKRTFGFSVDQEESKEVVQQALLLIKNLLKCKTTHFEQFFKYSQDHLLEKPNTRCQDDQSLDISESIKEMSFQSLKKARKFGGGVQENIYPNLEQDSLGEQIYTREGQIQKNQISSTLKKTKKLSQHKNSFPNLMVYKASDVHEKKHGINTETSKKKSLRSIKMQKQESSELEENCGFKTLQRGTSLHKQEFGQESLKTRPPSVPSKIRDFDLNQLNFEIGEWVDVLDSQNIWQEAQVIKQEEEKVKVHFNGAGDENDEWISLKSKRVHLFRTHTTCLLYTSPSPRDLSTSRMPSSA